MENKKILAIDVGGTNIKYALWEKGLKEVKEIPTPSNTLEAFLEAIEKIIIESKPIEGIALSFPGFINREEGTKHGGGALENIPDINLVELFEDRFKIPTTIENDAKAAALAETQYGPLKNKKSGVVIILGTGVGGGIVIDGEVLIGNSLLAGEFSFINTKITNKFDYSNCMGQIGGGPGLSKEVYKSSGLKNLNGREIFHEILENKNEKVLKGLENFCEDISWLINNLNFIINPDLFLIGGGISAQPLLIELIKKKVKQYLDSIPFDIPEPEIITCKFRSKANLIGAVINYSRQKNEPDLL